MATNKATPSKPKGGPSSVGCHQSFRPVLPCGNKLLQSRWDQTYYDKHRKLVKNAKPMVDTKAPPKRTHVASKWKKEQTLKERSEEINRDNVNLLDKMQKIMHTRGCVDHINKYAHHSLNQEQRQKEQVLVARENKELVKRLEQVEPMYKVSEWIEDWQRKEEFANRITSFPKCVPPPQSLSPTPLATTASTSPRDKSEGSSQKKTSKKATSSSIPSSVETTSPGKSKPSKQKAKKKNTSENETPPTSQDDSIPSNSGEPKCTASQEDITGPNRANADDSTALNSTEAEQITSQDNTASLRDTEPGAEAPSRSSTQTHSASSSTRSTSDSDTIKE